MNHLTKLKLGVRKAAGHDAIRIVEEQGTADGGELLAEAFLTYLRAFAAVAGWDEALHRVYEQASADRAVVHAPVGKLQIVVWNEVEIAPLHEAKA